VNFSIRHILKLNVRGGPGHERLETAKDFVIFLRRNVTPG
jgi:hypothetical protein